MQRPAQAFCSASRPTCVPSICATARPSSPLGARPAAALPGGDGRRAGRTASTRPSRPAHMAAISTAATWWQAQSCTCQCSCQARCSRAATATPLRATVKSASPPSSAPTTCTPALRGAQRRPSAWRGRARKQPDALMTLGAAPTFEEAARQCLEAMLDLICERTGLESVRRVCAGKPGGRHSGQSVGESADDRRPGGPAEGDSGR